MKEGVVNTDVQGKEDNENENSTFERNINSIWNEDVMEECGISLETYMRTLTECLWQEESDDLGTQIIFDCSIKEAEYGELHNHCKTLPQLIATVALTKVRLYDITRRKILKRKNNEAYTKLTRIQLLREAWKMIILVSQKVYKPPLRKGYHCREHKGILVAQASCTTENLQEIVGTTIVPLLGKDTELLKKIVLFKHWHSVPFGIRNVHHSKTYTLGATRLAPLPVMFFDGASTVRKIVNENCISCKKELRPLTSEILSYHRLTPSRVFARISIDLVGPILVKPSVSSRNKIKLWVMPVLCLASGASTFQVCETYGAASVVKALLTLEASYSPISEIVVDAGSQLQSLDMSGIDPTNSEEIKVFSLLNNIKKCSVRGQRENVVESAIKRIKRFWKNIYPNITTTLPTSSPLTFCDLLLLLQYTCNEINRTPYSSNEDIAPETFLKLYKTLPTCLDLRDVKNTDVQKDLKRLQTHYRYLWNRMIRNRVGRPEFWKRKRCGNTDTVLMVNDIVLIKGFTNNNCERMGQVITTNKTSARVRHTGNMEGNYKTSDLVLLVRAPNNESEQNLGK